MDTMRHVLHNILKQIALTKILKTWRVLPGTQYELLLAITTAMS